MRDVNLGMRLLSGHPRWELVVTVCLRFLFALQAVFLTICDSSWFGRQMSFDTLAGGHHGVFGFYSRPVGMKNPCPERAARIG
jgi:hypothetical protein